MDDLELTHRRARELEAIIAVEKREIASLQANLRERRRDLHNYESKLEELHAAELRADTGPCRVRHWFTERGLVGSRTRFCIRCGVPRQAKA